MEMVDQVVHCNQVKSKSIISQSADLQSYSSGIGRLQHPQSISYSVPLYLKSKVITSSYSYSPSVTSSLSQANNVTSLASVLSGR